MWKFLSKKGATSVDATVNKLFGGLVVMAFAIGLAPTLFDLALNLTGVSGVPAWVTVILPILIGVAIVFTIWRVMGTK